MRLKRLGGVLSRSSKVLKGKAAFGPFLYKYPTQLQAKTKPSFAASMLTKCFYGAAWGVGFVFCLEAMGLQPRFNVVMNESRPCTAENATYL